MNRPGTSLARSGTWLIAAAAVVGLVVALYDDLGSHNGIDHTDGALLVIISTALMVIAAALLLYVRGLRHWVRVVFDVLIFLDILGTGFAAYMLEANLLLALIAVALLGWLIRVFASPRYAVPIPVSSRGVT